MEDERHQVGAYVTDVDETGGVEVGLVDGEMEEAGVGVGCYGMQCGF